MKEFIEKLKRLVLIALGVSIYAFGFVKFNMANHLAEGGVAGVTLIVHSLYGINPAYTSLLLNLPLFVLGARVFGKKSLMLTLYGTILMSVFIWFWQKVPIEVNLNRDMMLVSVVAGLFAGTGSGLVFRYGATTGGTDIIGRVFEEKAGISLGKTLLALDAIVLLASLTYIDISHMFYTLIASFVFTQVLTMVQNGGYRLRGMLIITPHSKQAAKRILEDIHRGVTFLRGEGAYSGTRYNVLYVVLNPTEVRSVKNIMSDIDPDAFISVVEVDEVISSDFMIRRKNSTR